MRASMICSASNEGFGGVGKLECEAKVLYSFEEASEFDVDDLHYVVSAELVKHYNVVDSVGELGCEGFA